MKTLCHLMLAAAATLVLIDTAEAQDVCIPQGIDVCQMARQMADATAATLPMRINKNLSVQTVFAELNIVTLTAKFEYNKELLDQTLAGSGISNSKMLNILQASARGSMCTASSPTKKFVDSGGIVSYVYKFNDGSTYTNVRITSCA